MSAARPSSPDGSNEPFASRSRAEGTARAPTLACACSCRSCTSASIASSPPVWTSCSSSVSAASGSASTALDSPRTIAPATPGSCWNTRPERIDLQRSTAFSGSTATAAAEEAAARRHSVGVRSSARSRAISPSSMGICRDSNPRAEATCRQTKGSRSDSSRFHVACTSGRSNSETTEPSRSVERRSASQAALSSKRAASRREGSEPVDGSTAQVRSRSGRVSSDSARPSAPVANPTGKSRTKPTRGRMPGPLSPRREPTDSRWANATNVAAFPCISSSSTRRPSSRRSSPGRNAPASS
jgi:hypothetical protein